MGKLIKRFCNILNESPEGRTIRANAANKRHTRMAASFLPTDARDLHATAAPWATIASDVR